MKLSIFSVLTVIFVIAKLAGAINWSWWIVLLPTIISVCLALLIVFIVFIAAALDIK